MPLRDCSRLHHEKSCKICWRQHGFTIQTRRLTRCLGLHLTDLDLADEIALFTDNIINAKILLTTVKQRTLSVGFFINRTKTELMVIGRPKDPGKQLAIAEGIIAAKIEDFKYPGSWLRSSNKYFNVRRSLVFKACDQLWRIRKSKCSSE